MLELYLRFLDLAQAATMLGQLGIEQVDGVWPTDGFSSDGTRYSLDPVFGTGLVPGPAVETTPDEWTLGEPLAGYHVNLVWRGSDTPPELTSFVITPQSPALVWA